MKKRSLLAALVLSVLAGLIAGCDGLGRVDPSDQAVTFWYQHSGKREEVMKALIQEFNESNQWGITVTGLYCGSYAECYNRIITGIPTHDVPDISVAYQNQAATYITQDALVELTPFVHNAEWGFAEAELADFFPFVELGDYLPQFDGQYGFPPHRSMEVLYYNEDWLHRLGYDAPPRTWDAFAEMACAATNPGAGTFGYELSIDASTFADMVFNRGGSMVNKDATAYTFGDQAGLDALTGLQELFGKGCAVVEKAPDGDQADFAAGRVLFTFESTSSLPNYRDAVDQGAGFNWSVSTLPSTLDSARVNIYGASLSIFRSTPQRQLAAWLFVKWLTEPAQSARWTRATNYFPVRRSAADQLTDYFGANPQFQKAFGFLGHDIAIEPGVASYDDCRAKIGEMLSAVVAGENAASKLHDTVEECNTYLKEAAPD